MRHFFFIFILAVAAWTAFAPGASGAAIPVSIAAPSGTPGPVSAAPRSKPRLSLQKNALLSAKPYWKSKPALQKRMAEDRSIFVSVNRHDLPQGKVSFKMTGVGYVAREKDVCFKLAQDYPKLKDISDHFRTVTYEPATERLFVIAEALGYQSRMLLKLTPVSEDWRSEVQFEVIWGHFTGMKGVIGFERLGVRTTEISFTADYSASELPIPKVLMGFALEVVTQRVAEKMRTYIEAQSI